MRIVNLTPHPVVLYDADGGPPLTLPACPNPARCTYAREYGIRVVTDEGVVIPIANVLFGDLLGLPDPVSGTFYIVSAIAAAAAKQAGRTDVVIVDDTVRDESGRIIGARALARP